MFESLEVYGYYFNSMFQRSACYCVLCWGCGLCGLGRAVGPMGHVVDAKLQLVTLIYSWSEGNYLWYDQSGLVTSRKVSLHENC